MRRKQRGFTLVELLVVLFIVGILASLVLPAIMSSRAASRRIQCIANLSQTGKAILTYESLRQRLPASGSYRYEKPDDPGGQPLGSWVVQILAELDQQALSSQWDSRARFDEEDEDTHNRRLASTPLGVLVCPMDDTAVPGQANLSYVVNGGLASENPFEPFRTLALRPTLPMKGTWIDLNGDGLYSPRAEKLMKVTYSDHDVARQAGVFFNEYIQADGRRVGGSIPLSGIRDGLAQTILLSENIHVGCDPQSPGSGWASTGPPPVFNISAFVCGRVATDVDPWSFTHSCTAGSVNYENANSHSASPIADEAINGSKSVTYKPGAEIPWLTSGHRGGVNIFLADGSARFLSERVSGTVFASLVTPDGGRLPEPLRQGPLDNF